MSPDAPKVTIHHGTKPTDAADALLIKLDTKLGSEDGTVCLRRFFGGGK